MKANNNNLNNPTSLKSSLLPKSNTKSPQKKNSPEKDYSQTGKFSLNKDDANKHSEVNITTESNMSNSEINMSMTSRSTVNYSKLEIKELIEKIFLNFAKYNKEEKDFFLSQQSLLKIIKHLNLVDDVRLKLSDIDLILRKLNKNSNKMNQKQFLDFIVKMVNKMYPEDFKESPKDCVNLFIASTFEPYVKFIENNNNQLHTEDSQIGNGLNISNLESVVQKTFDSQINAIINSIHFAIKEIYLNYFHFEINPYKDKKKIEEASLNSLIKFCKDFEILPYLVNMNQLVTYFNLVMKMDNKNKENFIILEKDSKDIGNYYTLSRFCLLFIHFSIFSFSKNNQFATNNKMTDCDKLLLFLEKLEYSNGFQNLERKTNKPHTSKLTLIPTKYVLKMIDSNLMKSLLFSDAENEKNFLNENKEENLVNTKVLVEFNEKSKNNETFDLRKLFSINDQVFDLINSKLEQLREVFIHYCKMSGKQNYNQLGITSFSRFLRDCEIISEVSKEMKNYINTIKIKNDSKNKSKSKSPISKKSSLDSKSNKMGEYKKTISQLVNFNQFGGKLSLSDVNVIFISLTGPKNFDNSSKIKQHFDKNYGFLGSLDGNGITGKVVHLDNHNNQNNSHIHMKMDFYLFLKSFELIAAKLYPSSNINKAVIQFFEKNLSKVLDGNSFVSSSKSIQSIMDKVNQPEIKSFLNEMSFIMKHVFDTYTDSDLLTFEKFFDFCKDFNLFPDIVNLMQAKNIFYFLSEILINSLKNNLDVSNITGKSIDSEIEMKKKRDAISKNEFINFELFMDSLGMVAMFFKFSDQFKDIEKILYMFERMNQSKGLNKMQLKIGTTFNSSKDLVGFLVSMKERFPEFYSKKLTNSEVNKVVTSFEDIYADDN